MKNHRGFTLPELALVCGIMALTSTLGFSWLAGILGQQRLQLAADSFLSTAISARYQAVTKNLATQIRVHPDLQQFAVAAKDQPPLLWQKLPKGVAFSQIPSRSPTFYSRGFASPAGTFILSSGHGSVRIVISLSGRVRWQRIS